MYLFFYIRIYVFVYMYSYICKNMTNKNKYNI